MKRVRVTSYVPSLAAELVSIVENFECVLKRVYRRHGLHAVQVSLLRRALAVPGNLTETDFSEQTGVPPDAVCRAAKFLAEEDRNWVRLEKKKKDRRCQYIVVTPRGLQELAALNRDVEQEFFTSLKVARDSNKALEIAALARALNQELRDFVQGRQMSLL